MKPTLQHLFLCAAICASPAAFGARVVNGAGRTLLPGLIDGKFGLAIPTITARNRPRPLSTRASPKALTPSRSSWKAAMVFPRSTWPLPRNRF